jgi:hypothetical protein
MEHIKLRATCNSYQCLRELSGLMESCNTQECLEVSVDGCTKDWKSVLANFAHWWRVEKG